MSIRDFLDKTEKKRLQVGDPKATLIEKEVQSLRRMAKYHDMPPEDEKTYFYTFSFDRMTADINYVIFTDPEKAEQKNSSGSPVFIIDDPRDYGYTLKYREEGEYLMTGDWKDDLPIVPGRPINGP